MQRHGRYTFKNLYRHVSDTFGNKIVVSVIQLVQSTYYYFFVVSCGHHRQKLRGIPLGYYSSE